MKKRTALLLIMAAIISLSGCSFEDITESEAVSYEGSSAFETSEEVSSTTESVAQSTAAAVSSDMFTDRDMEIGYDEEKSAVITLTGESASCNSDAVEISGGRVTITDEGTYIIRGSLEDGMIVVNAGKEDKVQLVLDNTEITSKTSAAIYVLEADKVVITTALDSCNCLNNGGEYTAIDDNNIDSVIFSKADLTLNGSGTLEINAAAGHGIVSKDDLVLTSGTYCITAASHGLSGKDSVRIASGTYDIKSGKDGVHAENADDESLGFLYIANGTFNIEAEGDGMSASSYMLIEDGEINAETGGGSGEAAVQSDNQFFSKGGQYQSAFDSSEDTVSTKGLKASVQLTINGGLFWLDTADDSLHSNGSITISGGTFTIASGDDGIHADSDVTINGGSIDITQSYEGIEGLTINISGGYISLVSSDDGLNAAGGNDSSGFSGHYSDGFASTSGAMITISGGTLYVNASGDGIDSNGSLEVTGGSTFVSGPTDSMNGSLDYNGEATITGGVFVAAGSSGMAQNFSSSSTQGVIMVTVNSGSAGSTISLADSSGNELISWQADKAYTSVIVSCPEIIEGSDYTLTAGGTSTQITMTSLVYGSGGSSGMGGMGNSRGDMFGRGRM